MLFNTTHPNARLNQEKKLPDIICSLPSEYCEFSYIFECDIISFALVILKIWIVFYEGKVESCQPNLCETRDKRRLGREPDRNWCHCHTCVKLIWLHPMDPWTEWGHTHMLLLMSMGQWAVTKKALHFCGGDTSSFSSLYPAVAFPSFMLVLG